MESSNQDRCRGYIRRLAITLQTVCILGVLGSVGVAGAAGDASGATCATSGGEGFRRFLPDCRAYEMVTPPYKGGSPVFGLEVNYPPPISTSGSRMLGLDFAGMEGTGNLEDKPNEYGAIYQFQRTSEGWQTESVEPPTSAAPRARFIAGSADLSRTLWALLGSPGEELAIGEETGRNPVLAIREATPSGIQFRAIGSTDPSTAIVPQGPAVLGASSDLSHILFTIRAEEGARWPGDVTNEGEESLYEYAPGYDEPFLVGVSNEARLSGGTSINESAKLISKCGTVLGSGTDGTTYHAVSTDGAQVFFTAQGCGEGSTEGPEVSELYVRKDASNTIDVSEPSSAQCAACHVPATVALGRRAAVFEGASSDGTKAFFLSEQPLLPGAVEGSVNLYEYNALAPAEHEITLVAPDVSGVARVSGDGSYVYFVARSALPTGDDLSLPEGEQAPTAGAPNMYAFDTMSGELQFVATLSEGDEHLWEQQDKERPVDVTPDGQYAVFISTAKLTADDTSTVSQIFEYDASRRTLVRVSVGSRTGEYPGGFNDDGNTELTENAPGILRTPQYDSRSEPTSYQSQLSLTESGTVVFVSGNVLTPEAVPARTLGPNRFVQNIYEYREGNVYLISPGDESAPLDTEQARLLGVDESGQDIFFFTADKLLPVDVDSQADWYDAREDGGFPPSLAERAGCTGEACQGPLAGTPSQRSAGGSETADPESFSGTLVGGPSLAVKPLTRKQKLEKALKRCAHGPKRKRASCEKRAGRAFGAVRTPPRATKRRIHR